MDDKTGDYAEYEEVTTEVTDEQKLQSIARDLVDLATLTDKFINNVGIPYTLIGEAYLLKSMITEINKRFVSKVDLEKVVEENKELMQDLKAQGD